MNNTLKILCAKNNLPCNKVALGVCFSIERTAVCCLSIYGIFSKCSRKQNKTKPPLIPTLSLSLLASRKGHTSYGGAFVFLIWCLKLREQINVTIKWDFPALQWGLLMLRYRLQWSNRPSTDLHIAATQNG